jgi:hypothetical protein
MVMILKSGSHDTGTSSQSQQSFDTFNVLCRKRQPRLSVQTVALPDTFVGVRANSFYPIIVQLERAVCQPCALDRDISKIKAFCSRAGQ